MQWLEEMVVAVTLVVVVVKGRLCIAALLRVSRSCAPPWTATDGQLAAEENWRG